MNGISCGTDAASKGLTQYRWRMMLQRHARNYAGLCSLVDQALNRILWTLEVSGQAETKAKVVNKVVPSKPAAGFVEALLGQCVHHATNPAHAEYAKFLAES